MPFNPENPFEDFTEEVVKDTDISWDSPHHTLGSGATQAAPGNHDHGTKYLEPADVVAGNNISIEPNTAGQITINALTEGGVTDHSALTGRLNLDQHNIASVTGLQSALNAKANDPHTHADYAAKNHGHSYGPYFRYGRPNVAFPIGANLSTGDIVIAHGLGRVPLAAFVSADDDGGDCTVFASIRTWDASNLYCHMRNIGNAESHVYINWIAF